MSLKGAREMFVKTKRTIREYAEDLLFGVNTITDIEDASDLENMHLPIISAPERVRKGEHFEVTVEVGKLLEHPNEPNHFVEFIELYADDTYLARMYFTARTTWPIMRTFVTLDHSYSKLRAFERCNLHGTWQYETNIEVVE
jgi:superoxide reductase